MRNIIRTLQKLSNTWLKEGGSILLITAMSSTAQATTFVVNSTADPGDGICDQSCTIRDSIIAANENPGEDTIDFSEITGSVPVTITLLSGLPLITDSVTMDASIVETRDLPGIPERRPGIELDLTFASPLIGAFGIPFYPSGLNVFGPAASGSELRGFVINGIKQFQPSLCIIAFFNPDPADPTRPALGFCSAAVSIFGANGVTVAGNYLNLDESGEALAGNGLVAISLVDVSDSVIGGDKADDRNVMTVQDFQGGEEHPYLIRPWSTGWNEEAFGTPKKFNNNQIIGNYLGVSASGVALNPDARGIWLRNLNTPDDPFVGPIGYGAHCDNQAIDPCEMIDNVISGNVLSSRDGYGMFIFTGAQQNTVLSFNTTFTSAAFTGTNVEIFTETTGIVEDMLINSNQFGRDPSGTPSEGYSRYGFDISGGDRIMIENNVITGSLLDGVALWDNSQFGEPPATNVTLSQNSIYGNCLLGNIPAFSLCQGIDLRTPNVGPTPNDHLDLDSGANHLQNKPVLLEISGTKKNQKARISGELDSSPDQVYLVEFFANSALNAAGRAEGERFIGQQTVKTKKDGHAEFEFDYAPSENDQLATDDGIIYITATATRKHCETESLGCFRGSTSEFSQACGWDTIEPSTVICEE